MPTVASFVNKILNKAGLQVSRVPQQVAQVTQKTDLLGKEQHLKNPFQRTYGHEAHLQYADSAFKKVFPRNAHCKFPWR